LTPAKVPKGALRTDAVRHKKPPLKDDEVARLKLALADSKAEAEMLRSSLRFQIGDGIVGSLSVQGGWISKLRLLSAALRRGRALACAASVRNALFCGLPSDGLPPATGIDHREVSSVLRYIRQLELSGGAVAAPTHLSDNWAKAACALATEMAASISNGFALPDKRPFISKAQRNVLYLSRHDPLLTQNGYARRTLEITNGLVAKGHKVTVGITGSLQIPVQREGPVRYVAVAPEKSGPGVRGYVEALSERIMTAATNNGADLIHAASNYIIGLASISAGRRLGLPVVYEVRGLWEETRRAIDPSFGSSLGYRFQSVMEVHCAIHSDCTIVGSSGIGDELVTRGVDADRLQLAKSGAPAWAPTRQNGQDAGQRHFPPTYYVLGFAGSLTSYEGLETLASSLSLLNRRQRRFGLLIAGSGPHEAEARRHMERAGVMADVYFAGSRPFSEMPAAYAMMDLLVYSRASTRVTQLVESLKPLEGLAAGLPVIVSALPPYAELVRDCPAVMQVVPSDPAALAQVIEQFFARSKLERDEIGRAGREWVLANRSWSQTVETIRMAYASING
jgi:glycosyltransferase involved in cell wall biosynthesis